MSSEPFYKPDPRGWPVIADALTKPWPREAVEHDLVWWADQVAVGRVACLPGRLSLAVRWGWGEKRVRRLLDLEGPAKGQRRASEGPAKGQERCTENAENSSPRASEGPAKGQPRASNGARIPASFSAESCPFNADDAASPRARGTEPRSQITESHHENNTAHAPAQALTASPDVDGRAGVEEEQATAPTPRPLPIRPVPVLPVPAPRPAPTPSPPPAATQGECQNDRRQGRPNLAALTKPIDEDMPMPEPDEVPNYELEDLLRPGEFVTLPGTLDELLADARGMGRHLIAALRAAGIATTRELFERLPVESVAYTKGLAGARGNELVQHLGERWCVFLRTREDIEGINARTVYAADRRRKETQQLRAGLRVVGGER